MPSLSGRICKSNGIVPPECKLIGGWARIYRKGWREPFPFELPIDEYIGKKKDGTINKFWNRMPATMIRKCTLVGGLREAFSSVFGKMYIREEMNFDVPDINIPDEVVRENTRERDVTPPKDKTTEKSPDDRSWKEDIRAKLQALKGKPMGGMQKVWEDVSKKIGTMDRETAKLRVHKLYVLQNVVPGPDTDAYIKAISAAATADEILRLSIDFANSGPGVVTAMEADEKISALTRKILKFAENKNQEEKEVIVTQVDKIGKGKDRGMVLTALGNYARQLGILGVEDEGIY
jgi:hypothetical protein